MSVEVDVLVSRDAQVAFARGHGADLVTTDCRTLRGRSYDAVFDTFGAFVTEAVTDGGRYASIATQAGPVPDLSSRGVRTTVNQVREDGAGLNELESDAQAHMAGSELLVGLVDELLAVWDGQPARGYEGTADVVAYADRTAVPVRVLWPSGATRD
ncbi:hypothetical protein LKL35_03615 [Streptomyces sp. ET3-23]|uniref:hypothetical protein n=1 Tax=Streptomyces sp. ET3-23 TaxID=2885643 RepID=UPI001D110ED3|nr:hypothetical protein [Streptomyces sp. ET3-23]MCC2274528.1 hypothetical protein [Streptomyces sp. ET3-23]